MSTYTQNLYQIVFSTKYRKPTIEIESKHRLNLFIKQTITKHKCFPYIVNGTEDHLHIVMDLHPTVALSDLMRNIKLASSSFIKKEKLFRHFDKWQNGYAAFTYSQDAKQNLIAYVQNQEKHHKSMDYEKELKLLLKKHNVEYNLKYFPEKV